ncbi:MAG: metalloregulator ArsR/SmtB family transcription factor [Candidatus Odinarchaeota archaeon]
MTDKIECKTSNYSKTNFPNKQPWREHCEMLQNLAGKVLDHEKIDMQYKFFKALADKTRIKIIRLLDVKPLCVCEIMTALNLTQPTASHHLRILENTNLIREERRGKWVYYHINNLVLIKKLRELELL